MRRNDREITDFNTIVEMIDECRVLRLGLADGDLPYIVPVNFGYTVENKQICFYLHGAMAGRKYELMQKLEACSFEMDTQLMIDCIEATGNATTRYRSVMGTATIEFLEGAAKQQAIDIFMQRYEETRGFKYDTSVIPRTAVIKLTVQSITAKSNPVQS